MNSFSALSRYAGVEIAAFDLADGKTVAYVRRRFLPDPERMALLRWHEVRDGDRIDTVAAFYLGDPEQFWRICDANRTLRPGDLLGRPGTLLRIAMPEGFPGMPGA